MWVDNDDVFADDKVWAFKESNPEARTHIVVDDFSYIVLWDFLSR